MIAIHKYILCLQRFCLSLDYPLGFIASLSLNSELSIPYLFTGIFGLPSLALSSALQTFSIIFSSTERKTDNLLEYWLVACPCDCTVAWHIEKPFGSPLHRKEPTASNISSLFSTCLQWITCFCVRSPWKSAVMQNVVPSRERTWDGACELSCWQTICVSLSFFYSGV